MPSSILRSMIRLPGSITSMPNAITGIGSPAAADPEGTPVPLAGQSFLWVVFRGASAVCGPTVTKTYPGPSTLTPFYPELLVVSAAGDFEGYLSFGIGLAARGGYRVFTLTEPDRVVIDVSHVALGKFPGIWPVTSWPRYWALQYSWNTGHQPWLATPAMVVQAWARDRWHVALPVRQVNANTFQVGRLDIVTVTRPVTHGPWVITTVTAGLPPRSAESAEERTRHPAKTPGTVPGYVPGSPSANGRESEPITAKDGAPRPRRIDVGDFLLPSGPDTPAGPEGRNALCPIISTRRWRRRQASCTSMTCTCSPARTARC
jgi:hypothetical protein